MGAAEASPRAGADSGGLPRGAARSMVARLLTKDPAGRLSSAEMVYAQLSAVGAQDDEITSALLQAVVRHADERAKLDVEAAAVKEQARRIDEAESPDEPSLGSSVKRLPSAFGSGVPDLQFAWRSFLLLLARSGAHGGLFKCFDAQLMVGVWPESLDVSWDQDTLLLCGGGRGRRSPRPREGPPGSPTLSTR